MEKWLTKIKRQYEYHFWMMKELDIKDKDLYSKFIKETNYSANVWSSNFAYLWAHTQITSVKIFKAFINHMLVTFILTKRGRLYLPCLPYGRGNVEDVMNVLLISARFCFKWNLESDYTKMSTIIPINANQLAFLKKSNRYDVYFKEERLTGLERHYSISKLIDLKGKDFNTIRYKINHFNKSYPTAKVRNYEDKDFEEVMKLGSEWIKTAGSKYNRIIDGFYFENIMKNYKELDHLILVIELDGKIIGMISGGILPTGQAWGCLTKFINEYKGITEKLAIEMVKAIHNINPNVEYMNVGSDLGQKGLIFYKERFRPVLNYERYAVFFKSK